MSSRPPVFLLFSFLFIFPELISNSFSILLLEVILDRHFPIRWLLSQNFPLPLHCLDKVLMTHKVSFGFSQTVSHLVAMESVFVSPQNSYVETKFPMWYLAMGPLGGIRFKWGHGGRAPMTALVPLYWDEEPRALCFTVWELNKMAVYEPESGFLPDTEFAPWNSQPTELWKNKCLLFKTPSLYYFCLL